MRHARATRALLCGVGSMLMLPAPAHAHGIAGRADLPVPLVAFYWAAGIVLVVSFIGLTFGWRRPLLARWLERSEPASAGSTASAGADEARRLEPREHVLGIVGVAAFSLVASAAAFGSPDLNHNIAPVSVFVVWWIGIAVLAAIGLDAWRALHPAAYLARVARVPERRGAWPAAAGVWIAVAGLLAFTWLELVYPTAAHVRLLAALMLLWLVVTLAGMARSGVSTWLDNAEPFAVYTRVLGHMGVVGHRAADGRVRATLRPPVVGLTRMQVPSGMVAFVALLIGTVSYDGLSRTFWWKRRVAEATVSLVERGVDVQVAGYLFGTFGMLMMVGIALGAFVGAAEIARVVGRLPSRSRWGTTAQAFAPSLVPIALAYVVAHYFSFFFFQSQRLIPLASDPFGTGANWLGTAGYDVDYSTLSANAIYAVQVGSIVIGHVLGLALAHDRALEIEEEHPGARGVRSQWPMLALMILYTVGGLYFLSEGLNV